MSETILAALVGGLIGIAPSLTIVFVEMYKQSKQQKFDLQMKKLEMYELKKQAVLHDYLDKFSLLDNGQLPNRDIDDDVSWISFHTIRNKALVYVGNKTRSIMDIALQYLIARHDANECSSVEKDGIVYSYDEVRQQHSAALNRELISAFDV